MKNGATHHRAEKLIDWVAPAILALASAWSARTVTRIAAAGVAAGLFALGLGVVAMRLLGRPRDVGGEPAFEPVAFEEASLENELLLDDPLIEVEANSRVVRLFDRQDATPGEMVARIEDYLGDGRRRSPVPAEEGSATPPDAHAALHAALANIRASLR